MDNSRIEWTDATWNPVIGCAKVSPGCAYCYAERLAPRLGKDFSQANLNPDRLTQPLQWTRPRRIFVNSLSDLFWDQVPEAFVDRMFAVMALAPQHTFQILTKRPDLMRAYLATVGLDDRIERQIRGLAGGRIGMKEITRAIGRLGSPLKPLPNVWLGTSAENQHWADIRLPILQATPAAVRFVSIEPMLGPIDLAQHLAGLDWVIVGGESGPKARPIHPAWPREVRDQCEEAGVAFHFKQWGEWTPGANVTKTCGTVPAARWNGAWVFTRVDLVDADPATDGPDLYRVGKKAAGRLLDGRTWDGMPEAAKG